MQCYVKSAGKGYDQDYTWIQIFGKECDCTDLLRQLTVELSTKTFSLAIFRRDNNYYLLIGGLNTERTDIVGTPIRNTFAFVCPAEEEKNIRLLTAGLLYGAPKLLPLLSSVIREDIHSKLGFCASKDFEDMLANWLKTEGEEILGAIKEVISGEETKTCESGLSGLISQALQVAGCFFLWGCQMPILCSLSLQNRDNILLVNPDKKNNLHFAVCLQAELGSFQKVIKHLQSDKNNIAQQSQNNEETMNGQTPINTPLKDVDETDSFKIFLRTATRSAADYHFWNNSEPEWAENIKEKLFPLEIPTPGLNFYIAIEQTADSHHIWLQDDMQKITDGKKGRRMKVALLFEVSRKIKERTQENIECGIRNICATWTDVDSDFGNKLLREIIERKALIINDAFFEVNEAEIKKILGEFFNKGNSLESNPCQQEVCHIAKDWSGFAEAKRWFGEKLRTTCFAYDNSLLCYFTPCEVTEPEKVSYCARWSRMAETVIPKSEKPCIPNAPAGETTRTASLQMKFEPAPASKTQTSVSMVRDTKRPVPPTRPVVRKKKHNNYHLIGIAVLILLLIVMIKSCSESSNPKKEESLSPTKVEQSSAREGKGSKINKKSSSSQNNNKQK